MPELVAVLDAGRAALLRRAMRHPSLRAIFLDPRRRIPVAAGVTIAVALVVSLRAPLISLWLGAAIFGVPHVVAGVRQVAVRGRVEPLTKLCAGLGVVLGAAQIGGAGEWAFQGFALLFTLAAAGEILAAGFAGTPPLRAAAMLLAVAIAGAAGVARPALFLLAMTYLHTLGSLAWFALCARRRRIPIGLPVAAVALIAIAALTGLLDPLFAKTLIVPRSALASILTEATGAATPSANGLLLCRALFLYAFGQSLHFSIWLRLVPDVDRATSVPQTFRRALSLLRADLGRLAVPALCACALAIPLILGGGGVARESYFALTYFHFGLEAAALARILARAHRTARSVGSALDLEQELA